MNRKQWKLWLAGGAGVAVVATIAAISGPVVSWAQDAKPTAPTTEQQGSQDAPMGRPGGMGGRHGGAPDGGPAGIGGFAKGANGENLAEALGITVDELSAAKVEAANAAVDQALEAGLISDEQATSIRARIAEGDGDLGRMHFGMGFHRPGADVEGADANAVEIDFKQLLADALGITSDELTAAQESARDAALSDALAAGDITQAQLDQMEARSALREYLAPDSELTYEEAVAAALFDGAITQTQADALLEAGAQGPRGGHGGMGPRGRGGEGMPVAPGDQAQPTAPADETEEQG